MDNKQCDCGKDKVINDLLKRISNLEFDVEDKQRKIERLNNIINELKKWLKEQNYKDDDVWVINAKEVLSKLQELKGSDVK